MAFNATDTTCGIHLQSRNVYYLDAQAAETLGFKQHQDAPSELRTTCLNAARLEQPTSWCTGHQWMTLSYQTAHPGRLHQIVHHSASDTDEYLVPAIPTGWMLFWGSSPILKPRRKRRGSGNRVSRYYPFRTFDQATRRPYGGCLAISVCSLGPALV